MLELYGNWLSPFSRKVTLALKYKGLPFKFIDGLARDHADELRQLNPRREVPTLVDGQCVVCNSSDILDYLDRIHPQKLIYPQNPQLRVTARALERLSDTRIDAILVDCSYWLWADRADTMPNGLIEFGQTDLNSALETIEGVIKNRDSQFAFGSEPGVVEFALWPQLVAFERVGFRLGRDQFPATHEWREMLRAEPFFIEDVSEARTFVKQISNNTHETHRIAWRGDRIEWLLSRGYHDWFLEEIKAGRVIWPQD